MVLTKFVSNKVINLVSCLNILDHYSDLLLNNGNGKWSIRKTTTNKEINNNNAKGKVQA